MPYDEVRRAVKQQEYYINHRAALIQRNWVRQINALGCSAELYYDLLQKQNGLCAICFRPNVKGKKLAVDHCHKTNKIRGLLCNPCNLKMSAIDDVEWKEKAEVYLAV